MKWLIVVLILSIVLIAGCNQTQQRPTKLSSDAIKVFNIYWIDRNDMWELNWTFICNDCKNGGSCSGIVIKYDTIIDFPEGYQEDTVICKWLYDGKIYPETGFSGMRNQTLGEELKLFNVKFNEDAQITLCCGIMNDQYSNAQDSCKTATLPAKCT